MKIGLLTHHSVANFGANIQSTSTYFYLKSLGHDVCFLNYKNLQAEQKFKKWHQGQQYPLHQSYFETYTKQSPVLQNEHDVADYVKEWQPDLVVCGSDAMLWHNPKGSPDQQCPNPFWFTWLKDLPNPPAACYLSASSRGSDFAQIPSDIRAQVKEAFDQVRFFSVRDSWTAKQVEWITDHKTCPLYCPDPAFAFQMENGIPEDYSREPSKLSQSYILVQCNLGNLSQKWMDEFRGIAHQHGLEVYNFTTPHLEAKFKNMDRSIKLPLHPLEWYSWVQNAAGLITRLFHGQVCAMSAGVPFINIDSQQRHPLIHQKKSRASDLAHKAGCPSHVKSSVGARYFMSPQHAWDLLSIPKHSGPILAYANLARKLFAKNIRQILDSVPTD